MAKDKRSVRIPAVFPPLDGKMGADDSTHVKITVFYHKDNRRGYSVSFTPVKVEDGYAGTMSEIYLLFDSRGGRTFLAPATRFSAKVFESLAEKVLAKADAMAALVVAGDLPSAAALARDAVSGIVKPEAWVAA